MIFKISYCYLMVAKGFALFSSRFLTTPRKFIDFINLLMLPGDVPLILDLMMRPKWLLTPVTALGDHALVVYI